MTIRSHGPHCARSSFPKHAVEIVPNILLGHSKGGILKEFLEGAARKIELDLASALLNRGKLAGRERAKGTAAATTGNDHAPSVFAVGAVGLVGGCFADIRQLARRHSDFTSFARLFEARITDDFHLQIRARQGKLVTIEMYQDIGEYRQSLAPVNHTDHQ